MNTVKTHTPTPWEVDALGYIRGPNSENILEVKENAEFICSVVNSHDELLVAAKKAMADYDAGGIHHLSNDTAGSLRAAISKAESQ